MKDGISQNIYLVHFLTFNHVFSDYLEINDSMLTSLMMRHRTLSATNQNLVTNLTTMADSVSFSIDMDLMFLN